MGPNRRYLHGGLCRDDEAPFSVHGIAGVDRQVDQGRLKLPEICHGEHALLRRTGLDIDPAADQRADQTCGAVHLRADVEDDWRQRLPTGEGEQLPREP